MSYGTEIFVGSVGDKVPVKATPESALVITTLRPDHRTLLSYHRIRDGRLDTGTIVGPLQKPGILKSLGLTGGMTWMDDRVLASGPAGTLWYRSAVIRPMHWKINSKSYVLKVKWPTLVFKMLYSGSFQVWALQGDGRPAPSSKLLHAPIGNIHADGDMCWGSVPTPSFTLESRPAFESAVYDTAFTHANHPDVIAGRGDLFHAWRKAGRAGLNPDQMVPTGARLDSVVDRG